MIPFLLYRRFEKKESFFGKKAKKKRDEPSFFFTLTKRGKSAQSSASCFRIQHGRPWPLTWHPCHECG